MNSAINPAVSQNAATLGNASRPERLARAPRAPGNRDKPLHYALCHDFLLPSARPSRM